MIYRRQELIQAPTAERYARSRLYGSGAAYVLSV
jgi:hypothetical protein